MSKKQKVKKPELLDSSTEYVMLDKLDTLKKDKTYKLEKTSDKFGTSMVSVGYAVEGYLEYKLFDGDKGTYLIICVSNPIDYLRPSSIKGIVETAENSILFESQGGFYKLSWKE